MRQFLFALFLLAPLPAFAQDGPVPLGTDGGKFGDWTAAMYGDGDSRACYAFTTAAASSVNIPNRGQVLLTVTERPNAHDEVTIAAGYTFPRKAVVSLTSNGSTVTFYTKGDTAFTTNGAEAITAFQQGSTASSTMSLAGGGTVTDNFSLAGFSDAYSAITAECP